MPSNTHAPAARRKSRWAAGMMATANMSFLCVITASASTCNTSTSYSAFSSGCTVRMNLRAQASGWPMCGASFCATAGAPGPRQNWTRARPFTFHYQKRTINRRNKDMAPLKRILLAEDNAHDVELTLAALGEHNLANEV